MLSPCFKPALHPHPCFQSGPLQPIYSPSDISPQHTSDALPLTQTLHASHCSKDVVHTSLGGLQGPSRPTGLPLVFSTPTVFQADWNFRCLNLRPGLPYAVPSAYDSFPLPRWLPPRVLSWFPELRFSVPPPWALLQTLCLNHPPDVSTSKSWEGKDCFFFTAVSSIPSEVPSTEVAWNKYLWNKMCEWTNKWVNAWILTCGITSCKTFLIHVCEVNWINMGGKPATGTPGEERTLAL